MPADFETPEGDADIQTCLEGRLGRLHARQRLGIEAAHERQVFGQGLNFFHFENARFTEVVVRAGLRLSGLYGRARRNAADVQVRHNLVSSPRLPPEFDGYTVLQLSDLHVDISPSAMQRLTELLPGLEYDICVLTGDYRGATFGPYQPAIDGLRHMCRHLQRPAYGVLGNHDTLRMLPALEAMGVRMLLNECVPLHRGGIDIYLAGVDDAHFYRMDNLEKTAAPIAPGAFTVLLSHTPEIYRQAAHAGFDLMLCGHTHGGQLCLPGGIPLTLDSHLPRRLGAGAWRYYDMAGYTSVGAGSSIVPVRLNCPPEITLHHLRCAPDQ